MTTGSVLDRDWSKLNHKIYHKTTKYFPNPIKKTYVRKIMPAAMVIRKGSIVLHDNAQPRFTDLLLLPITLQPYVDLGLLYNLFPVQLKLDFSSSNNPSCLKQKQH